MGAGAREITDQSLLYLAERYSLSWKLPIPRAETADPSALSRSILDRDDPEGRRDKTFFSQDIEMKGPHMRATTLVASALATVAVAAVSSQPGAAQSNTVSLLSPAVLAMARTANCPDQYCDSATSCAESDHYMCLRGWVAGVPYCNTQGCN